MTVVHVCMVTKNKSVSATTLHSVMNIHMNCMMRGIHLDIAFVNDKAGLPKLIKSGERKDAKDKAYEARRAAKK